MSRPARYALNMLAVAAAVLVVAGSVLVARVAGGPLSVPVLAPRLEAALSAPAQDIHTDIQTVSLVWGGWRRPVDLRLENVTVTDGVGNAFAVVPYLWVGVSFRALLLGDVAPTRITVSQPRLHLVRHEDGSFGFSSPSLNYGRGNGETGDGLLALLSGKDVPAGPLGYLKRIEILDFHLTLQDGIAPLAWDIPRGDFLWRRDNNYITAEFGFELRLEERLAHFDMAVNLRHASDSVNVEINFGRLVPAALARRSPDLGFLAAFDMPVGGTLEGRFTMDGKPRLASFDISVGGGNVFLEDSFGAPVRITGAGLRGRFEPARHGGGALATPVQWMIEDIFVNFGDGATLSGKASATGDLLELSPVSPFAWLGTASAAAPVENAKVENAKVENGEKDGGVMLPLPPPSLAAGEGDGRLDLRGELALAGLKVPRLKTLWPQGLSESARLWVEANLVDGMIDEAKADFTATYGLGAEGFSLDTLTGSLAYRDLDLTYLSEMSPATSLSGTAVFNAAQMQFDIAGGEIAGLALEGGTVMLSQLDEDISRATITARFSGTARQAMLLLAGPRIDLDAYTGIDPASVTGEVDGEVEVGLPMLDDIAFAEVTLKANVQTKDMALPNADFLDGRGVEDADLTFSVDSMGIGIAGDFTVDGIRLAIDGRENYSDSATPADARGAFKRRHTLTARLTGPQIETLGLSLSPLRSGQIGAEMVWTDFTDTRREIDFAADLTAAAVGIRELAWEKPAGEAALVEGLLTMDKGHPHSLRSFRASGPDLDLAGNGLFVGEGENPWQVRRLALTRGRIGKSDVTLTIDRAGPGYTVGLRGPRLDLSGLLDSDPEAPELELPDLQIGAEIGAVRLSEEGWVREVVANLTHARLHSAGDAKSDPSQGIWRAVAVSGKVGEGEGRVSFTIKPTTLLEGPLEDKVAATGGRVFSLRSDDAGAFLRATGLMPNLYGGKMEVSAATDDSSDDPLWTGRALVTDYRIRQAPVLGRILHLASLTGIFDILRGEGIRFQRLEAPFTLQDGLIQLTDATTYGAEIGLTVNGAVDLRRDALDIKGTVAPAYVLNSVFGRLPIVGDILGGEKGGGLFAATYSLQGNIDEPRVAVNPLAVFTPGVLRKVFSVFDRPVPEMTAPLPKPNGQKKKPDPALDPTQESGQNGTADKKEETVAPPASPPPDSGPPTSNGGENATPALP